MIQCPSYVDSDKLQLLLGFFLTTIQQRQCLSILSNRRAADGQNLGLQLQTQEIVEVLNERQH